MASEDKLKQIFAEELQLISTRPLPVYTASWGNGLSRPVELPEHFDSRIDIEHVFVFSVNPETGENLPFYVTSRPCTSCSKIKQMCSRTRPTCVRCQAGGKDCVWREGFFVIRGLNYQKKATLKRAVGLDDAESGSTLKRSRLYGDVPSRATFRTQPVVAEKAGYSSYGFSTAASHDNAAAPPASRRCSVKSAEGMLREPIHVETSMVPPEQQLSGDSTNAPLALRFFGNAHVATIHDPNPKNSDTHQREQNALTVTPSVAPADTMEQGLGRMYLKELTRDYPKAADPGTPDVATAGPLEPYFAAEALHALNASLFFPRRCAFPMANDDEVQDGLQTVEETLSEKLKRISALPLPDYTADWGEDLSRPTELPEFYDHRIDLEHIFVFAKHPLTGVTRPLYVTPRSCENCQKAKQVCSRTRPTCKRCDLGNKVCVAGEGYTKLGGPKCEKPKLKKKNQEPESSRPTKKPRIDSPVDLPRKQTLRPRVATTAESSPGPDVLEDAQAEPVIPAPPRVSFRKSAAEVRKLSDSGQRRASGRGRGRGGGRGSGRRSNASARADENQKPDGTWTSNDGTKWRPVYPTVSPGEAPFTKYSPNNAPRIWAKNKDDLLAIMPELSTKTVHNVFWDYSNLEPPILFLSEGKWPEEKWESTTVSLTFVREFTQKTVIPRRPVVPDHATRHNNLDSLARAAHLSSNQDFNRLFALADVADTQPTLPPAPCNPSDDSLYAYDIPRPYSLSGEITIPYPVSAIRSTLRTLHDDPVDENLDHASSVGDVADRRHQEGDFQMKPAAGKSSDQAASSSSGSDSATSSRDDESAAGRYSSPPTSDLSPPSPHTPLSSCPSPRHTDGPVPQVATLIQLSDPIRTAVAGRKNALVDVQSPIPSELPPEISHLLQCMDLGIPLRLLASRDSALLPIVLDQSYGVVFLGFFKMKSMKPRLVSRDVASGVVRVAWDLVLKWAPGGENVPPGTPQPSSPWWYPSNSMAVDNTEGEVPYTLLPFHLCTDVFAAQASSVASEIPSWRGWHCLSCGQLNTQRLLCYQKCDTCQTGNGQRAVGAQYVRDPHGMDLSAHPADRIPEGVECDIESLDSGPSQSADDCQLARVFTYSVSGSDAVKLVHLYTCNRPGLQTLPNSLFTEFQLNVPLAWQEAKTRLATGPYFTYLAGDDRTGSPSIPWSSVPECITRARKLIDVSCRRASKDEHFSIGDMAVLAWHSTGSRKCASIDARKGSVAFMCLGADIELSVAPACGIQAVQAPTTSSQRAAVATEMLDDLIQLDPMDSDDEEEIPLSVVRQKQISASNASPVSEALVSNTKRKKASDILVTLVHGDMLVLSGDEFEWSLKRTGMSIPTEWASVGKRYSYSSFYVSMVPLLTSRAWVEVLICGGTDWARLGRKSKNQEEPQGPDLLEPHILRSLSNVKATAAYASHSGCHFVVIDIDGFAWLFGRGERSALGVKQEVVSENAPIRVTPQDLGAPEGTKFVHAACGRNHTLLVGSEGQLWTCGANHMGQCGHSVCAEVDRFKAVNYFKNLEEPEKVVKVAAGVTFSLALTESGKVYAFGSAEKGQLGNGKTGEHIVTSGKVIFDAETEPLLVRNLEDKKVVQIACGQQHSVALTEEGRVTFLLPYNDVLIPKIVPQFAGPNKSTMAEDIVAGPTSTLVIDRQRMFWLAGKWKNTGDGSAGQPYSSFRFMPDIQACKISYQACGGVTHFLLTPDDDGSVMTICFGQGASNGELGLGVDEPKSATKPTKNVPLTGIDVFKIAGGQCTTLFIAKPSEKLTDLPRHPEDMEAPDFCVVCNEDHGDDNAPLECDKCDNPWHLKCLDPPLDAIPDGEWFCPDCEDDIGGAVVVGQGRKPKKSGQKRKAQEKPSPVTKRRK
ncbi:hypothetical protein EIP86_004632 [Pleurotus ostreatoroseus]|nr:hypothetical protein EIP86_004632 [Pleurotus ostreatoroseus]